MAALRFTTTRLSGLSAAGRLQELQHATIAPFLERELGPPYGRLFADFEAESSDVRAWYADTDRAPQRIDALGEPDQEALRQRVADMIGKIGELAERLMQEGTQKANLARILTAATTFPVEDVWLAGDQPIIVNWGFHRSDIEAGVPRPIKDRIGLVPVTKRVPPPPPPPGVDVAPPVVGNAVKPAPPRRWRWFFLPLLLWLVFAVLVAGSYRLLLPACGLRGPLSALSLFDACPAQAASTALAADGDALQAAVDRAELDLARQKALCTAPTPRRAERPPSVRTAEIERDVQDRLPQDAPRGAVEVSLIWNSTADLDLIILCPNGDKLWQGSPGLQACGGQLLRDINRDDSEPVAHPIEQAAWPRSPQGRFDIQVALFAYNGAPDDSDIPFTIRIRRGDTIETIDGHVKGARTIVAGATKDL